MLLRRVCFAVLLLCFQGAEVRGSAQSASNPQLDDKADIKAFAALFRRVNSYESLSKAAKSSDVPQARLSTVLPRRFELSETEAKSLREMSSKWQLDSAPLRQQVKMTVQEYRALFRTPPVVRPDLTEDHGKLQSLQQQLDAITVHYRDALRNTMPDPEFKRIQAQVEDTFVSNQTPIR